MNKATAKFACIGAWGYNESAPDHGLTVCHYDGDSGTFTPIDRILPYVRVGGVCRHPALPILYCPDECTNSCKDGGGHIVAILADAAGGALTELNRLPSFGGAPSYCATDAGGTYLLVVNHAGNDSILKTRRIGQGAYKLCREYDEANIVLFPLAKDGRIEAPCDIARLDGSGPRPSQVHAKPHCVMASPDGSIFLVCDYGADRLYTVRIDRNRRKLDMRGGRYYTCAPGDAPRYAAFHPTEPFVFTNNEDAPYVYAFRYADSGRLTFICKELVAEPPAKAGESPLISDIRIHPNGQTLYNLSRAYNTVTVLGIGED
ncbi:MAG: lactonase family protein, partial [Peptococcaceae bacterium]|nr:lactonase family protein [Peptococcaceae bacterium]